MIERAAEWLKVVMVTGWGINAYVNDKLGWSLYEELMNGYIYI